MLTLEERFTAALHNAARCWRQALDRHLKSLGIGQAGWMAIAMIAKAGQPQSQTDLAHKLGVEDPTMMSMIDRLVKAGFVTRQPSATDRRVKLAVLTADGLALYRKVKTEADAFRLEFLADVDKEKLRSATEMLEALDAAVEARL